MKNLLLLIPLLICSVANAQLTKEEQVLMDKIHCKVKGMYERSQVKKYTEEAISITPVRTWVKSLDNSNWYYGYKVSNDFRYVHTYSGGLSDLSSMYPTSYRNGDMRELPRLNFVRESYDQQFTNATRVEPKPVVVPFRKGHSRGFDWIDKPRKHHEGDYKWKVCRCGTIGYCSCGDNCRCIN